jgi:hypothetical protein
MNRIALSLTGLLGVVAPHAPAERSFVFRDPVSTLTALPGETVALEAMGRSWRWTAPSTAGLYPIRVQSDDQRDSITIQAFVLVPYNTLKGEYLNGYRIGRYPTQRRPPVGFIEVTRANENTFVSPHFRLKQFLCKQSGSYPKYVVLNEALLQTLEYLLAGANAAGYTATTFHVMSGYRTPAYNHALGNVLFSRHTLGAAADVFIDEDNDGRMDDLNGDGRSDFQDGQLLYRLFETAGVEGGMGEYPPTRAHGPFVHVDVRDRRARW